MGRTKKYLNKQKKKFCAPQTKIDLKQISATVHSPLINMNKSQILFKLKLSNKNTASGI
jgi:hypothetical protein